MELKTIQKDYKMVDALPMTGVNVVFKGVEGAYSYAAMRAYFSDAVNSYHVKTFRDAMEEVASGKADYAVLPNRKLSEGYCDGYLRSSDGISVVYRRGTGREKWSMFWLGIPENFSG